MIDAVNCALFHPMEFAIRQACNPYFVQPILKSLRLLEAIGWKAHDVTLTELAHELASPRPLCFATCRRSPLPASSGTTWTMIDTASVHA